MEETLREQNVLQRVNVDLLRHIQTWDDREQGCRVDVEIAEVSYPFFAAVAEDVPQQFIMPKLPRSRETQTLIVTLKRSTRKCWYQEEVTAHIVRCS